MGTHWLYGASPQSSALPSLQGSPPCLTRFPLDNQSSPDLHGRRRAFLKTRERPCCSRQRSRQVILRKSRLLRTNLEFRSHRWSQPKQFSLSERVPRSSSRIPWFVPRSIPVHHWPDVGKCTTPW